MTVNLIEYQARRLLFLIHGAPVQVYSKKNPAEIGEGITIVFGVMKGGGVRSNHIVSYYKYLYIN